MKDFDVLRSEREQRERSFKIAGRTFHFRPAISAQKYSAYLEISAQHASGWWPAESFDVLNGTLLECLESDSRAAWNEVIAANDNADNGNPISMQDIDKILEHILGVQNDRPTIPSSLSGITGENGSTRSTEGSASQVVAAPTGSISDPS